MASGAVTKYKEQIESMKRRASSRRLRDRYDGYEQMAVQMGVGYALGKIEESTGGFPSILGIDGKLFVGGIAAVGGVALSGRPGRWLQGGATSMLTCALYQAGKSGTFDAP